MAQRTPSSSDRDAKPMSPARKAALAKAAAAKPATKVVGTKAAGTKVAGSKATATKAPTKAATAPAVAARKAPPTKKSGKSIVNQKQTPWGLIAVAAVIVVFAASIIVYAVASRKSSGSSCTAMIGTNSTSYLNELKCAQAIQGVTFKQEPNRNHETGTITYDSTPPVGGNHNPYWADCTGTVYPEPIANENAVHMLEHGAVWVTYKQGLDSADVDTLSKYVTGKDRMAMSPYPDLKTNISLQAWGYQLFVDSPTDPRIQQFINALRYNPKTTPEDDAGVTCSQPTFKQHPSTFGSPLSEPAS